MAINACFVSSISCSIASDSSFASLWSDTFTQPLVYEAMLLYAKKERKTVNHECSLSDSTTRSFHSSVLRLARLFNSQWLSWVQLMTSFTRDTLTFFYNWRCTVSKGSRLVPLCFSCIFTTAIRWANGFDLVYVSLACLYLRLIFSHL